MGRVTVTLASLLPTRRDRHRPRCALCATLLGLVIVAASLPIVPQVVVGQAPPTETAQADPAALTAAKDLYRNKKYEEAEQAYQAIVEAEPTSFEANMGVGRCLERMQRFSAATKAYQDMLARIPDRPEPHYRLGIVYRKTKNYSESIASYRTYIAARPMEPDAYFGVAESLRENGDTAEAIEAYKRYIELETRPDEQQYVERARDLVVSLQAPAAPPEPELPEEGTGTAVPSVQGGVAEVSIAQAPPPSVLGAGGAGALDASQVGVALQQADAAFQAGDFVGAATRYRDVALASPQDLVPHYKLGVALAAAGDYGAAIDAWEATQRIDPEFKAAREGIDRAKRRLAVDAVIDAPALEGDAPQRRGLATEYLENARDRMALRAADALAGIAPQDTMAYRLRARAHLALSHPKRALGALQTELALQPGDFGIYLLMGDAFAQLDGDEEAAYFYELYLDTVDPDGSDSQNDEIRARIETLRRSADGT